MTGPTAARIYSHAERMRVVFGILTCLLLMALDQTVVLPAIPQIASSLHGHAHLSWVVSAYLLTTTATTPIYGKLSDQLGRRVVLAPALFMFLASCVVCALAGSVPWLIAGRALQGLGGGALGAVAQAAVADVVPPRERGRYQAWFAGTWAFASVAGPVAGGFITQHLSWRWIFWGNLPLGLLAMGLSWHGLRGLRPAGGRSRIDYAGAGLLMGSVALLLLGLSAGGVDFAWRSPQEMGVFALAILGFMALAAQQRRAPAPLLPGPLLRRARFVAAIGLLNSAAMFTAIFLLPLMLQSIYRVSPGMAGLQMVPFLFATTVGAFTAGQVTRRTGLIKPVLVATLLVSCTGFGLLALPHGQDGMDQVVAVSALAGLGLGGLMPTTLVAVQSLAGPAEIGAMTGILLLLRAIGGAFGATVAGVALTLARHHPGAGFEGGFLAGAALLLAALALALRMVEIRLRTVVGTG